MTDGDPPDLVRRLKRLRLGGLLPTLPDRAAHTRRAKLSHVEFLELLLQDEIDRRNSRGLQQRLAVAGFEEEVTPEAITWDSPVSEGPLTTRIPCQWAISPYPGDFRGPDEFLGDAWEDPYAIGGCAGGPKFSLSPGQNHFLSTAP